MAWTEGASGSGLTASLMPAPGPGALHVVHGATDCPADARLAVGHTRGHPLPLSRGRGPGVHAPCMHAGAVRAPGTPGYGSGSHVHGKQREFRLVAMRQRPLSREHAYHLHKRSTQGRKSRPVKVSCRSPRLVRRLTRVGCWGVSGVRDSLPAAASDQMHDDIIEGEGVKGGHHPGTCSSSHHHHQCCTHVWVSMGHLVPRFKSLRASLQKLKLWTYKKAEAVDLQKMARSREAGRYCCPHDRAPKTGWD